MEESVAPLTSSGCTWPVTDGQGAVRPTCSSPVFSVRFVADNRRSITISFWNFKRFPNRQDATHSFHSNSIGKPGYLKGGAAPIF